jgi:hypothetical protein
LKKEDFIKDFETSPIYKDGTKFFCLNGFDIENDLDN